MSRQQTGQISGDPPRWQVIFSGGASKGRKGDRPADRLLRAAPDYDPDFWGGLRQAQKNCYAYAAQDQELDLIHHFPQPGQASGMGFQEELGETFEEWMLRARRRFTEEEAEIFYPAMIAALKQGVEADGMIPADAQTTVPEGHYLVALAVTPQEHLSMENAPDPPLRWDYHWYRLDRAGTWSHKPGRWKVQNTDESGAIITCPENCDRGKYHVFLGYYLVPQKGLQLTPARPAAPKP